MPIDKAIIVCYACSMIIIKKEGRKVNVTIAANSFTTVSISTNFLAKAMAFCQVNVNDSVRTRYITYCNDISNVNVRMSIFKIRKVENIV